MQRSPIAVTTVQRGTAVRLPSSALGAPRREIVVAWALRVGLLIEAITCFLRFEMGITAIEFDRGAHVLVRLDHTFWSVPLFAAVLITQRRPRQRDCLLGAAVGNVLSDVVHHFVVLPLTVGNIGWHWP